VTKHQAIPVEGCEQVSIRGTGALVGTQRNSPARTWSVTRSAHYPPIQLAGPHLSSDSAGGEICLGQNCEDHPAVNSDRL
jgi:hypothetical protein